MEKELPQISFIIVNFESRELLPRCLASVAKIAGIAKEIIVVNNDQAPLEISGPENCPFKLIQSPRNFGFGSGINLGARSAAGRFLFFLNPDAEIISDPFRKAIQEFERDPELAILGAKIIDNQEKTQDWIAGNSITPWRLIKNNLGFDQNKKIREQKASLAVDWVSGGAMMVRQDVFQKLGGFDEKFFLYWEDVDLCRRAGKSGRNILYFPEIIVRHAGGQSFKNKAEQKEYYYSSQDYYFQKHFGKFSAGAIRLLRNIVHL